MKSNLSEEDLSEKERIEDVEYKTLKKTDSMKEEAALALEPPNSRPYSGFSTKYLTKMIYYFVKRVKSIRLVKFR